jgi:beta-lactamase class A
MPIIRRQFVLGAALLIALGKGRAWSADMLADVELALGGRIGVSVLDTGSGKEMRHRADERFAMCSTFKVGLVGAILAAVDRGALKLGQFVPFGEKDILSNAPVTTANVGKGGLSLEALCAAAIEVSDNTAANLLLQLVGGPQGFTAFFRSMGDDATRLDRMELALNSNLPDDPRDTTTPDAMRQSLQSMLLEGGVLSATSRDRIVGWMLNEQNGRNRLRSGLPAGWPVANKPGTGANGATNDIAIAWPPGGVPIVISVYVDAAAGTHEGRIAAIAKIGRHLAAFR